MKRNNKIKAATRKVKVARAAQDIFLAQHIHNVHDARRVINNVIFSLRGEETHNM